VENVVSDQDKRVAALKASPLIEPPALPEVSDLKEKNMAINWPWKKKYAWAALKEPNIVTCFQSSDDTQIMGKNPNSSLREARRLTPFHDAELARCTKEINAILAKVRKGNKDPNRELAFLRVPDGLFLAWTQHAIGSEDDATEINRVLGIK